MNNLSFCWNCWIRCVEIDVICVALIFLLWAFFSTVFHNIEVFSTFLLAAFPCKYWLWQLWKMFLVLSIWLIPANGWVSYPLPLFPLQVKWVCAACNRRKIQCLLCFCLGLAVLGATAQWLCCIVHLCRSFLGFQVLLLNYILPWRFMSFLLAMQR